MFDAYLGIPQALWFEWGGGALVGAALMMLVLWTAPRKLMWRGIVLCVALLIAVYIRFGTDLLVLHELHRGGYRLEEISRVAAYEGFVIGIVTPPLIDVLWTLTRAVARKLRRGGSM